jgi:hypothetical protein
MDVDADAPATIPSETTRYSPHTQSKRSKCALMFLRRHILCRSWCCQSTTYPSDS